MLKIGNVKVKSRLILAPMAGISDFPFRVLNRKHGCEFAFIEMINARALSYKNKKTRRMLYSDAKDRPLGVQIVGCEPAYIRHALAVLAGYEFDVLDFNAACPVGKVVRRGEGAALLRDVKKLNKLLSLVVRESKIPVTVKIRTGWDTASLDVKPLAHACEDAGVHAIFVHGRTRTQGYSGEVDYAAIGKIKNAVCIPVVASGNIFSAALAKKMLDETGCDGLLVARGALGSPWIFKQIHTFLKNGRTIKRPPTTKIIATMIEHLESSTDYYGEKNGVALFRKFFIWYTKGLSHIRPLREKVSCTKTKKDMHAIINACPDLARLTDVLKGR